jgi:hypothetical protein
MMLILILILILILMLRALVSVNTKTIKVTEPSVILGIKISPSKVNASPIFKLVLMDTHQYANKYAELEYQIRCSSR